MSPTHSVRPSNAFELASTKLTNSGPGLYVSFGHNAGSPTAINGPQNGPLGVSHFPTEKFPHRLLTDLIDRHPRSLSHKLGRPHRHRQRRQPRRHRQRLPNRSQLRPSQRRLHALRGRQLRYSLPLSPSSPLKPPSVQGYTIPITCSCAGRVVTGCNKPLFADGISCANEGPGPICYNPLNNSGQKEGTAAAPFFEPCQGAAYTYPNDSGAGSYCESNLINCCVGSTCPGDPKQHSKRAEIGGHVERVAVDAV